MGHVQSRCVSVGLWVNLVIVPSQGPRMQLLSALPEHFACRLQGRCMDTEGLPVSLECLTCPLIGSPRPCTARPPRSQEEGEALMGFVR